MNHLYILCIDDQPEVLHALENDLAKFESYTRIEVCDTGEEALALADEIDNEGDYLALIISDQVMPNLSGVEVLQKIEEDERFPYTRKVLLTGLATHQDTIEAINQAGLDHYIQKPWDKPALEQIVAKCLTEFILKKGIDYESYLPILDQGILFETLRKKT